MCPASKSGRESPASKMLRPKKRFLLLLERICDIILTNLNFKALKEKSRAGFALFREHPDGGRGAGLSVSNYIPELLSRRPGEFRGLPAV